MRTAYDEIIAVVPEARFPRGVAGSPDRAFAARARAVANIDSSHADTAHTMAQVSVKTVMSAKVATRAISAW